MEVSEQIESKPVEFTSGCLLQATQQVKEDFQIKSEPMEFHSACSLQSSGHVEVTVEIKSEPIECQMDSQQQCSVKQEAGSSELSTSESSLEKKYSDTNACTNHFQAAKIINTQGNISETVSGHIQMQIKSEPMEFHSACSLQSSGHVEVTVEIKSEPIECQMDSQQQCSVKQEAGSSELSTSESSLEKKYSDTNVCTNHFQAAKIINTQGNDSETVSGHIQMQCSDDDTVFVKREDDFQSDLDSSMVTGDSYEKEERTCQTHGRAECKSTQKVEMLVAETDVVSDQLTSNTDRKSDVDTYATVRTQKNIPHPLGIVKHVEFNGAPLLYMANASIINKITIEEECTEVNVTENNDTIMTQYLDSHPKYGDTDDSVDLQGKDNNMMENVNSGPKNVDPPSNIEHHNPMRKMKRLILKVVFLL